MILSRPSRLLLVLIMVSTAVFSSVSRADDDTWDASAYKDWSVSSVKVAGLDEKTASALEDGLALALSGSFLGLKKPIFFPQTLDEDIRRIRLFLSRRGYPYARVGVRFEPVSRRREVGIIFDIDPGPPVRVESLRLNGIPEHLEEKAADMVRIPPDSVLVDREINAAAQSLVLLLREEGYARAEVDRRVEWRDSTRVDVLFDAKAGPVYYFGETVVSGADEDLVPLVKRVVTAHRGERFDPGILEDSQKNLRVLGLFRQIRLDLRDTAADTIIVAADLSMREPRRIETGVRYRTDEELDLAFRWTHRNLFKKGRGGAAAASASSVLQRAELSAWWPAVLFARSRLSTTAGVRRENEESYEQIAGGIEAALSYEWTLRRKTRWGVIVSNVVVNEKTPDVGEISEQDGLLTALTFSWELDLTDHPVTATRGTFFYVDTEWAPDAAFTDYHYWRLEPGVSVYFGIPRTESAVLAMRLSGGLAEPTGASVDILPSKRFYSGGGSSMRGFGRRKLGPLDSTGAPLGGEAMLEGSVELRFPLFWRLRGASFVDSGQVWPTIDEITPDNIEVAVGSGLWLETLIGPLRADLAYRLTTYEETQPRWVFHFSIGPAF